MPTLRDSSSASSLRFATIASASACSRRARSFGGVRAPRPVERGAGGLDGAVDVGLAGHRGAAERLAGRGLEQLADLAGRRLDVSPLMKSPYSLPCRDRHEPENTG